MAIVKLTQFIHPFGNREETSVELPDEICEMAKGQVLSCEMMPNDYTKVVFYSRKKEWEEEDEDCEIADNGPGNNSPKNALERLICRVNKMQDAKEVFMEVKQSIGDAIHIHVSDDADAATIELPAVFTIKFGNVMFEVRATSPKSENVESHE